MTSSLQKTCPKCNEGMIEGQYTGNSVQWLSQEKPGFLQQSGRKIASYACDTCGYIENYVKS